MLELYHIMVRLTVHDGVSRGLSGLSKKFARTNEEAVLLQNNINKIKSTMLAGAGMAFMGGLGLFATAKMLKPASEYLHTLTQANAVGMKHVEIANLVKAAWETTAKVQTVSAQEALQMGISLRRILGSSQRATQLLPEMAKFKTAFIMAKESGRLSPTADASQMVYTAAKAAEMSGRTSSVAVFDKFMNNMIRVVVGTAGKVTPTMYMGLLKYARGAGMGLSDTTLFRTMPILMEEMALGRGGGAGGARGGPGSVINAWYRMMVQGVMTKGTKGGFESLGLLTGGKTLSSADLAKYKTMYKTMLLHPATIGKGVPQGVMGLPLVGGSMAASDPIQWIFKYLEPALRKKYPTLDRKQLAAKASLYFKGNSLAAWLASNVMSRPFAIHKEMRMLGGVPSTAALMGLSQTDPNSAMARVSAQWKNVMTAMGTSTMRQLIPALNGFADVLNKLATFFKRHPRMGGDLIIALGALSSAMLFGGVVMLLRGAILGLGVAFKLLFGAIEFGAMATGIGEIALALLALYEVIKHWKTLYPAWKKRSKAFKWDEGLFHPFGQHKVLDHSATANKLGIHIRPHTEHRAETHILMDGKKVGKIVSKHIGNDLSKSAINQKSNFDIGLSLPTPNYNF